MSSGHLLWFLLAVCLPCAVPCWSASRFLSVSQVDACFPVGPLISLPGERGSLLRALSGRSLTPVRRRPLFTKDVIGLATHLRVLLPHEVICGDSARRQCLGIRAPTQESGMQLRSARAVSVALGTCLPSGCSSILYSRRRYRTRLPRWSCGLHSRTLVRQPSAGWRTPCFVEFHVGFAHHNTYFCTVTSCWSRIRKQRQGLCLCGFGPLALTVQLTEVGTVPWEPRPALLGLAYVLWLS